MIKNNFRSAIVAIAILYLSTSESSNLKTPGFLDIPNIDKLIHFGMYFTFMFVLIYEHRKKAMSNQGLLILALIPFIYGIIMEVMQALFTSTRSADLLDIVFNSLGIAVSAILCRTIIFAVGRGSD